MIGQKFGHLVVVAEVWLTDGYGRRRSGADCLCACGKTTTKMQSKLKYGDITSCGCMRGKHKNRIRGVGSRPEISARQTTHGMSKTGTYSSWQNMRQRCDNPKAVNYAYYGGRGIRVCERWESFDNFLADMGKRPEGMTLDRYPDKDGNYEPENCRWATQQEQADNRVTAYRSRKIYGVA